MSDDNTVEKHISAEKLKGLIAADKAGSKRAAEERGAVGAKLKKAQDEDNLDLWVFSKLKAFARLDAGKLALRWRTMLLYADMLGFNDQKDIEDFLKEQDKAGRSLMDQVVAGEISVEEANRIKAEQEAAREQDTKDILAGGGGAVEHPKKVAGALATFTRSMDETMDIEAVNLALDRFTLDYPEASADALKVAQARLHALNEKEWQEAEQNRAQG